MRQALSLLFVLSVLPTCIVGSANGGTNCAACTLIVGIVQQYGQIHSLTPTDSMKALCAVLPTPINAGCDALRLLNGGKVAKLLNQGESPDTICNVLKSCKDETAVCRLFPKPHKLATEGEYKHHLSQLIEQHSSDVAPSLPMGSFFAPLRNSTFCKYFKAICNIINQVSDHRPAIDLDQDGFSTEPTLRGSDWRGKDCNDLDASIHPGRIPGSDDLTDTNCNGIKGLSSEGRSYEDMWCKGTKQYGTVVAGDSVGAHFHLPPNWFNASAINNITYQKILTRIEDELDWPMLSTTTGHFNTTSYEPDEHGPMDSIYNRLVNINRCNHRDYANMGVNGARAESVYKDILPYLNRSVTHDQPVIFNLEVVGNDVCDHQHSISHMTTPKEYAEWMTKNFVFLDQHLPKGSHILSIGLVDGRVLWDNMHDRIHPIGWTNKDVTYADLYEYLNCLDSSPCWGWMNGNATIRNETYTRAMSLNTALEGAIKDITPHLNNTQIHYLGDLLYNAIRAWEATGKPGWVLIEPVDGFHPNQLGNWWFTQYAWPLLEKIPGLVPPVNPNNAEIKKKFGDQGGY